MEKKRFANVHRAVASHPVNRACWANPIFYPIDQQMLSQYIEETICKMQDSVF
jgi:hypothetical protein